MRLEPRIVNPSFKRFRLSLFRLAPSRKTRFLAAKVRAGFKLIVLTGVAVKENDLLRGLVFLLRHGVCSLQTALAAVAFWTHDPEASASSVASASAYRFPENVWVLAVIVAELNSFR